MKKKSEPEMKLEEKKTENKKERIIKQRRKHTNTNPALRVPPAETRLTVYRWIDIRKLSELVGQNRGSARIDDI